MGSRKGRQRWKISQDSFTSQLIMLASNLVYAQQSWRKFAGRMAFKDGHIVRCGNAKIVLADMCDRLLPGTQCPLRISEILVIHPKLPLHEACLIVCRQFWLISMCSMCPAKWIATCICSWEALTGSWISCNQQLRRQICHQQCACMQKILWLA